MGKAAAVNKTYLKFRSKARKAIKRLQNKVSQQQNQIDKLINAVQDLQNRVDTLEGFH
ncbi:MAG: hypothetical protein GWN61_17290 [candidate division Zixibacteria bacterium]|nr:hypothetical protein [candidate division KSB1 bacterium]NIV07877.1 hypothetical protein [candidate division Zixibacteria bacterium]NIS23140.1 hypothetical protein [candidate division KSB1 bacterium]NIT70002.1 hypothetical protein [candidate division KSB1 bacterium]NIU23638.1 hypothetical protein [candidate division KSB1 bacterium]